MALIYKILRYIYFYTLFLFLCLFAVAAVFESWPDAAQISFVFVSPGVMAWCCEWIRQRRIQKRNPKRIKPANRSKSAQSKTTRRKPQPVVNIPRARDLDSAHGKWQQPKESAKADSHRVKSFGRSRPQGWIAKSESVTVANRCLDGMLYVGTPPMIEYEHFREKCRAYIDPSLSVATSREDKEGDDLPHWPSYSDISPKCRAAYLNWLSTGRCDPSYNPGYMFLYFYGLERRYILEAVSSTERADILEEVRRLMKLHRGNRSVQRYLGEFCEFAQLSLPDQLVQKPVFDHEGWDLPISLKIAVGSKILRGESLSSDWVLSWLLCHPESRIRTPATRCFNEFRALFELRFDDKFPKGMQIKKPRKRLKVFYSAASREFQTEIAADVQGQAIPDISGLRTPVRTAQEIADEVMTDLDKFSRYIGRNPQGRGTLEAQALLPFELWKLFPSTELKDLDTWARETIATGGLVPVLDLVTRLEGARPEKLGKRQITGAADALARIGYGLAPDPRFALRLPKPSEPVVLFNLGSAVEKLEDVSDTYRKRLVETALGAFVAHADGQIVDEERLRLLEVVDRGAELNDMEKRRLAANIEWLLVVPPDIALLRRKLKDIDEETRADMRTALISSAQADGVLQSEEVASMEKLYKLMGLDSRLVYSDLHAGALIETPEVAGVSQPESSDEKLLLGKSSSRRKLDSDRISAIRSDTDRVSAVLGQIFSETLESEESEDNIADSPLKGLDIKHAELVRDIIQEEHWPDDAFNHLCDRHGLLANGALETVNEWTYDVYDDALLEQYEGYEVAPEIADALKLELAKETQNVQIETP